MLAGYRVLVENQTVFDTIGILCFIILESFRTSFGLSAGSVIVAQAVTGEAFVRTSQRKANAEFAHERTPYTNILWRHMHTVEVPCTPGCPHSSITSVFRKKGEGGRTPKDTLAIRVQEVNLQCVMAQRKLRKAYRQFPDRERK